MRLSPAEVRLCRETANQQTQRALGQCERLRVTINGVAETDHIISSRSAANARALQEIPKPRAEL